MQTVLCENTKVPVFLKTSKVTAGFRAALFEASEKAGLTPSEFALRAAGEKLASKGACLTGIFQNGDLNGEHA